jgi:V8-like Glu-specific endopeptidase
MFTRARLALAAAAAVLTVPAAAVLTLPSAAGASPADQVSSEGPGVAAERAAASAKALEYWTPRRMSRATPLEVDPPSPARASAAAATLEERAGAPISIPPAAPEGWRPDTSASLPAGTAEAGGRQSIPYASFEVFDTTAYPNVVHGIIFFRLGRLDYSCSGTVVTSPGQSVVVTAGHCVHFGGRGGPWASHWVFVPGYHDKQTPLGVWAARRLFTLKGWRKRARFAFDFGAAAMNPDAAGVSLEAAVGARGIAFNQPREQAYRAFGYPVSPKPKYDGESLWVCDSVFGLVDPYPERQGPPQSGIGCDMGAGSSGGGWVIGDEFVNSVSSFGYAFYPDVLFGTYLGDAAVQVYARAVAG